MAKIVEPTREQQWQRTRFLDKGHVCAALRRLKSSRRTLTSYEEERINEVINRIRRMLCGWKANNLESKINY